MTPTPLFFLRLIVAAALFGVAAASLPSAPHLYLGPSDCGMLEAPPRAEASGIAASHLGGDYLWVHDDSGGGPALYAINPAGRLLGSIRLAGVKNIDWEDVASFRKDGKAWLLVADTGDNYAKRSTVALHLVEEPPAEKLSPDRSLPVTPAWSMPVRFEDGPRDCESVAVDVADGAIYLLSKSDATPRLYRLDFAAGRRNGPVVTARFVGDVADLPASSGLERLARGRPQAYRSAATALDISSDGRFAVVLTYTGISLFERTPGETWADALAHPAQTLPPHNLLQAEGACFSPDGKSIYVVSEGAFPLIRYDRQ